MTVPEDVGMATIRTLRSLLEIEPEWEVFGKGRALLWWPYRQAQFISASEPEEDGEFSVCRVSVETDVFSLEKHEWDQVSRVFDAQSTLATMSHWGWADGIVRLRCAMSVHEEVRSAVADTLSLAAIDQAEQAARMAAEMPLLPPSLSGERQSPHPLIGSLEGRREVSQVSDWAGPHLREIAKMLTDSGSLSTADGSEMTTEFPYGRHGGPAIAGGTSNLLTVSTNERHPRLGAGFLMRLGLRETPVAKSGIFGRARDLTAADLNEKEWSQRGGSHLLGAWCLNPLGKAPVHVSFFPNSLASPETLLNLIMSEGLRSHWASSLFAG